MLFTAISQPSCSAGDKVLLRPSGKPGTRAAAEASVRRAEVVGPTQGGGWTLEAVGVGVVKGVKREYIEKEMTSAQETEYQKLLGSYKLLEQR